MIYLVQTDTPGTYKQWVHSNETWVDKGNISLGITTDDTLDSTSSNPIQNTAIAAQIGYFVCGNGYASSEIKDVDALGFKLPDVGGDFKIKMNAANTHAGPVYLRFNSSNATKAELKYNRKSVSPTNTWEEGEVISVYYDGTYYQASNAQSDGGKAEKIKYNNSQSRLAAENVQGALDEVEEILEGKETYSKTDTITFAGTSANTAHYYSLPKGNLHVKITIPSGVTPYSSTATSNGFELRIPSGTIVYQKSQKDFANLTLPIELNYDVTSTGSTDLCIYERLNGNCSVEIDNIDFDTSISVEASKETQIESEKFFGNFAGSTTNTYHSYSLPDGYLNIDITLPSFCSPVQSSATSNGLDVYVNSVQFFQKSQQEMAALTYPYTLHLECNGNRRNVLEINERMNGYCVVTVTHRHTTQDRVRFLENKIFGYKSKNKYIADVADAAYYSTSVRDAYWSVGVEAQGIGRIKSTRQEYSSGSAWADYRLCTYEDGSPIVEGGKMFMCIDDVSSPSSNGVYSFDINTLNICHIGEIVASIGERIDIAYANHIMYNRMDGYWYVYTHFGSSDNHYLYVGKSVNDPRYGINNIDFSLLDYSGKANLDEDSFVYYDSDISKWVLVYSKQANKICKQTSDYPDSGFGNAATSSLTTLTGPTITKIGGTRYIICGSGSDAANDAYKVLDINTLAELGTLNLDYPTGGWRGWGTIIPLPDGLNTKYILMTFDRIASSSLSNWTYGNLYVYESQERNSGHEFDIIRDGITLASDIIGTYTPMTLTFHRKLSTRYQYKDNLLVSEINTDNDIFMENGNPYPIIQGAGLNYKWFEHDVMVYDTGTFELLGGSHQIFSEYVIDLNDMAVDEVRYLRIWNADELAKIRFKKLSSGSVRVLKDNTSLATINTNVSFVRIGFFGKRLIISSAN